MGSVLELDEVRFGGPEVVNGGAALDRPVRWVHVADSEGIGALLEGGELVLSTAAGFRTSAPRVRRFLRDLEDAGAVGALIELVDEGGLPDRTAIATVRQAVEGLHLPVVVLRRRVKFVRVTQAAHRLLIGEQLARVERSRQVHEVFTQLNLDGADEQEIVDTTSQLLRQPVLLEDVAQRVLLSAGDRSADEREGPAAGADLGVSPAQVVLGAGGNVWGRLVAPEVDPGDLEAILVLERAGQALTLARMASRDQEDLLQRAQAGFVQALVAGDLTEDEARARAADLGLTGADAFLPVAVHLTPGQGEDPTRLQLRERALLEEWVRAARPAATSVIGASLRMGTIALLLGLQGETDAEQGLTRTVERVRSRVDRSGRRDPLGDVPDDGAGWTVGVAAPRRTLTGAAAGLEEAAQVARTAAATRSTSRELPFYRFSDIRLRGLIALLAEDPRVRTFAEAELGPLLEGSPAWGLDLLRLYLRHGGNKSEVARAGHLSRQALYARLRRLEQVLGVSLDDPESRASLHVALLWVRLNQHS